MDISIAPAKGKTVLAALSGGADSVALVLLLKKARDRGDITLIAAHFEHGIRGADSLEDAEFCRELCRKSDIPFYLGRAPVPEIASRSGEGLESCARRLRHRFLDETAVITGAELIATAHHLDDQAETVLMHLMRGAGPEGVTGMSIVSGRHWRPLINTRKSEIIDYLSAENQPWREDSTNQIGDNPRNFLRLEIMPRLESIYPGASRALARYARAAQRESEFVGALADSFFNARTEEIPNGWRVDISSDCPEVLLRRCLRKILGPDLTAAKLDEICEMTAPCNVFGGLRAEKAGKYLYITRAVSPNAVLFNTDGVTELSGICRLISSPAAAIPEKTLRSTQVLDRESLEGAVLRTRAPGDRIAPLGMNGTKSLSDYFTDLKTDKPLRDIVPILARGNDVLWVLGHGISRHCALANENAVRIRCEYTNWGGLQP